MDKYIQEKLVNNSDYDSVYEEYKYFGNKLKEIPKCWSYLSI